MEVRQEQNNLNNQTGLNVTEIDTIGEILNISMGAAATAVSILLNRQVSITTPSVQVIRGDSFEFSELEPALGIEIKYIGGLLGSNQMIMSVKDVNTIVRLLLGDDGEGTDMDEIHISALGEVMNQMMGASCTALASFLDREIDISPPIPFNIEEFNEKLLWSRDQEYIVAISFKLAIEGLIDSEFFTVMTVPFARELVSSAMGMSMSDESYSISNQEDSQITGHTQVPAPIYDEQYQTHAVPVQHTPLAQPAPAPMQTYEQQAAPAAMPSIANQPVQTPAYASAPVQAPAYANTPVQAPAYASPPVQVPVYASPQAQAPAYAPPPVQAPVYATQPAQAPAYASQPVQMPAYTSMPAQAPAYVSPPVQAAAYPQMPSASAPRPAAGYAPERPAPKQNVTVKPLQFGSLDGDSTLSDDQDSGNLNLVMGVDLNVTVEIGRTRKQVKEILALRQGSIVELDKQAGAPVDIMVNGKLIARGDVVVIDDNFGVRITEIVTASSQR